MQRNELVIMKDESPVLNLAAFVSSVVPQSFKRAVYKFPKLSNIIRRGLNQFAPDGLRQVSIAAGTNEGLEMLINLQIEKDYWLGTYEPELQQVIESLVKPEQIIYDIGANIGFLTLMFARRTGVNGYVYAFEALPENVIRLRQNVELNEYQDRVTVVPAAVLDKEGEAEFWIGPSDAMGKVQGSAGRDSVDYPEKLHVQGISIDGFIETSGSPLPDIIKMDIEGGEVLAIPGMVNLLQEKQPLLLIELHGSQSAKVCWHELIELGYRICRMETGFPQVEKLEDLNWKSYVVAFPYHE